MPKSNELFGFSEQLFIYTKVTITLNGNVKAERTALSKCGQKERKLNMNRTQAMENLKSFGIEEPTDEQVTNYLNQVHGESNKEKQRAEAYKAQADKANELEKKLDELNSSNLSDIEKANKDRDDALGQIDALNKKIADMELKAQLAEKGIVGEDAENLIKDGKLDIETLGKIISEREIASASAKEKELLMNTPNPKGNGGKPEDAKPIDVENAEKLSFGVGMDTANKDYYKV